MLQNDAGNWISLTHTRWKFYVKTAKFKSRLDLDLSSMALSSSRIGFFCENGNKNGIANWNCLRDPSHFVCVFMDPRDPKFNRRRWLKMWKTCQKLKSGKKISSILKGKGCTDHLSVILWKSMLSERNGKHFSQEIWYFSEYFT